MQDRLNAVCFRAGTDNRPDAVRQSTVGRVTKRTVHDRDDFICMAFHESAYQRFLVGKVLIERADADTSPLRHSSGGRSLISRSEEHTSELQSLMRIPYAVFCLIKNTLYSQVSTSTS